MAMRKALSILVLFLTIAVVQPSRADREFSPYIDVSEGKENDTDTDFKCYSISIPKERFESSTSGKTSVYRVKRPQDELLYTFDWYARGLILQCGKLSDSRSGMSLVRIGRYSSIRHPQPDHIGIEFYLDGKLVKRYMALDFVKSPKSYWSTESHYLLFWGSPHPQFVWRAAHGDEEGRYIFSVQTGDRRIEFDPVTGSILKEEDRIP